MPLLTTYNAASRRGFTTTVATPSPPPIGDGVIAYQVPESWSGSGFVINSIGTNNTPLYINRVDTTYVEGPPAYVSPAPFEQAETPDITSVSPSIILSLSQYSTLSFWCWMPLRSFTRTLATMAGPLFDGIYIAVEPTGSMTFTTNGANYDYVQTTSSPVFAWDTWQMITFTYTLANTPSTCYVNATQVLSFSHPSGDYMNTGTYTFAMLCVGGRWNQVNVYGNKQISQAEVTAKFTAERGYYAV